MPHLFICQSGQNLSKQLQPRLITDADWLKNLIYYSYAAWAACPHSVLCTLEWIPLVPGQLGVAKAQTQLAHTARSHLARCGMELIAPPTKTRAPVFPPYLRFGSDGQMARWGASHIHYPLCPLNATSRASRAKLGKLINASAFVLARLAALNLMPVFDAEFTAASALLGLVGGRGQPASEPCLLRCNLSFICLFTLAPEQIEIKSTAATMPPTIPIAR